MKAKPQGKSILYIKVASLEALCRHASSFDYNSCTLVSIKSGSGYRIILVGEPLGKTNLAYYVNVPKKERTIAYSYPSESGALENAHFIAPGEMRQNTYLNIIGMENAGMREAKKIKPKDVILMQLDSVEDLIGAAIKRGIGADAIYSLYAFEHKGRQVLCGFDVIEELSDDTRILYYAFSGIKIKGKFARYRYSENKMDFIDYMGEHSYMYAKIIPLAEPFPFFKVPD